MLDFYLKRYIYFFLFLIKCLLDVETAASASRDSGHKTISREDDESDEPNPGKPDLLSLLRDIVSPFLS